MNSSNCFLIMSESLSRDYKFSFYNLYLDDVRGLVYNTLTQAIAEFDDHVISENDVPELIENGFIIPKATDEFLVLEEEYNSRSQFQNDFHLIIATTLDCQFRCCYCYENHPLVYMDNAVKNAVVDLIEKHAVTGEDISIVWYGGEPLLDYPTIYDLSTRFCRICDDNGVSYNASMISNGYSFSPEIIANLDFLRINSIQITLDGMKDVHDKRRPLKGGLSSFNTIVDNMKHIQFETHAQIHLRINVDKNNISSAFDLLQYCSEIGLLEIDVNLGMLKAFGCHHSCGIGNLNLFSMNEFAAVFLQFRDYAKVLGFRHAIAKMHPEYKVNSCIMDAPNSYVIDPSGMVYKCISHVGKTEHSIGNVVTGFNTQSHTLYSPFSFKKCINCKYFPICKGGCLLNNLGPNAECNVWNYITEELVIRDLEEVLSSQSSGN